MGMRTSVLDSPIGPLRLVADGDGLRRIHFAVGADPAPPEPGWLRDDDLLAPARTQLTAWFRGERRSFDLPMAPQGTPFQRQVWALLARIPWGSTTTYGALALALGKPGSARAVGAANGANPLPIVLPCHRVIGADGSLTGFGGGLDTKRWLLAHEGHRFPQQAALFEG
jgi:methylated-DNA-[protein]-cysteine S-methyltransferase